MLERKELKIFCKAVNIIDEYFDYTLFDTNKINKIIELESQFNVNGINLLLNKKDINTANELLKDLFNISIEDINKEAYKKGFKSIIGN